MNKPAHSNDSFSFSIWFILLDSLIKEQGCLSSVTEKHGYNPLFKERKKKQLTKDKQQQKINK